MDFIVPLMILINNYLLLLLKLQNLKPGFIHLKFLRISLLVKSTLSIRNNFLDLVLRECVIPGI